MQGGCPLLADWGVGCSVPPSPLRAPKTTPNPQAPDTVERQLAQEYGKVPCLHRHTAPPALPRKTRPNPTKGFQTQPLPNHPQPPRPDRERRPAAPHPLACCRRLPAVNPTVDTPCQKLPKVSKPNHPKPPRPDRDRAETAPTRRVHPLHRSTTHRPPSPAPFDIPHAQAIPCPPNPPAGRARRTLTLSGGPP